MPRVASKGPRRRQIAFPQRTYDVLTELSAFYGVDVSSLVNLAVADFLAVRGLGSEVDSQLPPAGSAS